MAVFWILFVKILPLYALMLVGFIAGRYLHVQRKTIGILLIYIFLPVVYFTSVATTPLTVSTLSLPFLFFFLCTSIAAIFLRIGSHFLNEPVRHVCAQACGSGNYGYFAIPVAAAIFPPEALGLVVLSGLGFVLYENTIGYFLIERGKHSVHASIMALEKLPALWAIGLGIISNVLHIPLHPAILSLGDSFRGGFTVLGMMMVGLGLSTITYKGFSVNHAYIGLTFLSKFIIWPTIMAIILMLDIHYLHLYSPLIQNVLLLMAIIPLAANTIIYAITLKIEPENVALAVLLSTLFALFFIPLITQQFIQ